MTVAARLDVDDAKLEQIFDIEIEKIPEDGTAEYWARQLHSALGLAREAVATIANKHTIFLGKDLLQAKIKLPRGQWLRMFKGHPNAVAAPLPFSEDTAERWMRVANHPALSNSAHCGILPEAITTLGVLAGLSETVVTEAIASGAIHPTMTKADAEALRIRVNVTQDEPTLHTVVLEENEAAEEQAEIDDRALLTEEEWHESHRAGVAAVLVGSACSRIRGALIELRMARKEMRQAGARSLDRDLRKAIMSLNRAMEHHG